MNKICPACHLPIFESFAGFAGPQCRCRFDAKVAASGKTHFADDATLAHIADLEAKLREANEKLAAWEAQPVYCWVLGDTDEYSNARGFVDAFMCKDGEFTTPLIKRSTTDTTHLDAIKREERRKGMETILRLVEKRRSEAFSIYGITETDTGAQYMGDDVSEAADEEAFAIQEAIRALIEKEKE